MTAPRPWKVNPGWSGRFGHMADDSPILDANGRPVIEPTESIDITAENVQLIVDAVNAYAPPAAVAAEPVAWRYKINGKWYVSENAPSAIFAWNEVEEHAPLYAAPPAAVPPMVSACFAGLDHTGRPIYRQVEQAPPAAPDADEDAYVIDKLAKLLAEIAVIVNGPEPPLTSWSYHDLPEKVRALKQAPPAARKGAGNA